MTKERKDELYDSMFGWIFEHLRNDEELFRVLNGQFGMTLDELHEHSIDSLDRFFPDAQRQLAEKVRNCYDGYLATWKQMTPDALLADPEGIYAVTRVAKLVTTAAPMENQEDLEYMLRFVNPLEVMAGEWIRNFGMGMATPSDEIKDTLAYILDTGYAEEEYEMEPEFCESDAQAMIL